MLDFFLITLRIWKYKWLSNCQKVYGKPQLYQPVLLKGKGTISFGKNVQIGVIGAPCFYNHYAYVEARTQESEIVIGNNVAISNGFSAEANANITIKDNVLIGVNCSITDNDGHNLDPQKRHIVDLPALAVTIEENVFIGDNVAILKGVTIGQNAVIGKNAVVTTNIPVNAIAAGNPARVIRVL